MKENHLKQAFVKFKSAALALPVIWAMLAFGCTQTIEPPTEAGRSLTVRASLDDPLTGNCTTDPATPAWVALHIINDEGAAEIVDSVSVNGSGIAEFNFNSPINGVNFFVTAYHNLQYARFPAAGYTLMCQDTVVAFCFGREAPEFISCPNIRQIVDSVVFRDENGNRQLTQGRPQGIGEYYQSQNIFYNNGSEAITVTIPPPPAPFSIESVVLDGADVTAATVTVEPGQSLRIVFAVSTATPGDFRQDYTLGYTCESGASDNISLELIATVIELGCECPVATDTLEIAQSEPVQIGNTETYSVTLFENNLECIVTINSISAINDLGEWVILQPSNLPVNVQPNASLNGQVSFTPMYSLSRPQLFRIEYTLETGDICSGFARLSGEGCADECPYISLRDNPSFREDYDEFGEIQLLRDSLYQVNGIFRVEFSPNQQCIVDSVTVVNFYSVYLPDSVCCEAPLTVNLSVSSNDASNVSFRYFTVTPQILTVGKGFPVQFQVRFTAPTVEEFNDIFDEGLRVRTGNVADSTFSINISLLSPDCNNCSQEMLVHAIVTSDPAISPIRNLRAYDQVTGLKPNPEAEVVSLGSSIEGQTSEPGLVFSLRDPGDFSFPNPPDQGDFYVVVDRPNQTTQQPPRPPKIQLRGGASCYNNIKLLRQSYPEDDFDRLAPIVSLLQQEYDNSGGGYFQGGNLALPVDNVIGGNVYVIYSDAQWGDGANSIPCCLSLIYIREVKDGTENNTNHQSAIEFRVINPVTINPL